MSEIIYQNLAKHLYQLPGFSPTTSGAEIRIIKRLFTLEEAELAIHLTLNQEKAQDIAQRAKLPQYKVEELLTSMEKKGLIFSVKPEEGPILYQAAPFLLGIYEFQIDRKDKDFFIDFEEYQKTRISRERPRTLPQMRTIPVGKSINTSDLALPYQQVDELINLHDHFAVANCICRQKEKLLGRGCDALDEACLFFGDYADFYVRTGLGRKIEKHEVKEILAKADKSNLVLRPTYSKFVSAICCCCGCCCGGLVGLNRLSRPAEVVTSSYIAEFEPENCINCGVCLDRCQMNSLSEGDSYVTFNADRCIGCGLCVSTCPSQALKLTKKVGADEGDLPDTLFDTWITITKDLTNK